MDEHEGCLFSPLPEMAVFAGVGGQDVNPFVDE
jgi:hypothetical protein